MQKHALLDDVKSNFDHWRNTHINVAKYLDTYGIR
jgi:hypothetical protein